MHGGASLTSSGDHQAALSGAAVPSLPCLSYCYSIDRRGGYRTMSRGLSYETLSDEKRRHFLHSCYLCKQPLARNRDVFMYRGDTPFCSEECRQEQIEMDEALEEMKLSSEQKHKPIAVTSPESQKIHVRDAGTAVAG